MKVSIKKLLTNLTDILFKIRVVITMFKLIIAISMTIICVNFSASAAEIEKIQGTEKLKDRIIIKGDLLMGDQYKFNALAVDSSEAVVEFESAGGNLLAGIEIGKAIRLMGYVTQVKGKLCSSACATAWIAGNPRIMDNDTSIGFHQVYLVADNGDLISDPMGNAIFGAYLNQIGMTDAFIKFSTEAKPNEIRYLTRKNSAEFGVPIIFNSSQFEAIEEYSAGINTMNDGMPNEETTKLFKSAAHKGFAGAQNNYGDQYEHGFAVNADEKFAIYWYTRSAERGEPTAYLSLAHILSKNTDDHVVLIEALKFAQLASAGLKPGKNKKIADDLVISVGEKLTADEKIEANNLVLNWTSLYQEDNLIGDSLR